MSNVHLHIPSFNAGELSPLLGARFAVEKVNSGCRKLRNFVPHVHGPAFRRPGMEYMGAALGNDQKSSLRSFNFSTSTGFILELHPDGLQVWDSDGLAELVNEVALPYSESECAEVQMAQVNDVVYLAHPNHAPRKLVRYPNDSAGRQDWRISEVEWDWPALGDENVRDEEIATPDVTELFDSECHEWAEFIMPAGEEFTFDVVNPDLSSAPKVARLQRFVSGAWENARTLSWTTAPPTPATGTPLNAHTYRITYSGPVTATGSITAVWDTGNDFLAIDVAQPASLQATNVAAGEWQVLIDAPADDVPAAARLHVQKWNGSAWVTLKTLRPTADQLTGWRGPTLTETTPIRLKWTGRAMSAGEMSIEQLAFPVSDSITLTCSHTSGDARTLTASEPIFQEGHIGSYWQIVHRRDASHVTIAKEDTEEDDDGTAFSATETAALRVQGSWDVFTYGSWSATLYLEKRVNGVWEVLRSWEASHQRNVIANGTEDQEVELRLRVSAGSAKAVTGVGGCRFTLEANDARVYGLVRITDVGALDDNGKTDTATVDILTTLHATSATTLWTEGAWSDVKGFPRAVAIHGQRLWWGGTRSEPLRLWGSVIADFENYRRGTWDDASLSFTPAETEANAIQGLRSFESELIIRTSGGEGTLSGSETDAAITPTSVRYKPRSGYGSSYLPDVLLGGVVVFVQGGSRKIRQVAPRAEGIQWSAADVSVLAPHVTKGGVVQLAAMKHPFSILWAVTGDGNLLGMTFEQEQNVFAWHVHETDGTVESVAVVKGVDADEVWLSVLRNGQRNIERLDPEVFAKYLDTDWETAERLIYSDGAVRYTFDEETTGITGLDHLNGKSVIILGDGADLGDALVVDGAVTLPHAVTTAVVGLPFTSRLQPMRMDVPMRDGSAQFRRFKSAKVGVSLHQSLGGQIADGTDGRFDSLNFRRVSDAMDSPPPLYSGDTKPQTLTATTRDGIDVVIQSSGPHPLNVGALGIFADVYDD